MNIRESIAGIAETISDRNIPDANLEAEVLLRHVLGLDRAQFYAELEESVSVIQAEQLSRLLERRLEGEPLAYLLGTREFYGLDFVVKPSVLIPRQESELLVDKALEICSAHKSRERIEIADVGTGCGAIAIAVAHNLPRALVFATDISDEALAVADINRRKHSVTDRVDLRSGDLLDALPRAVDVIVSNPPYLKRDEIPRVPTEVRREPMTALDGGVDGLQTTERLLRQAPGYLRPGGRVLVEIAPEQLKAVCRIAHDAIAGARVTHATDLLGLPRVVVAQLP